MRFITLSTLEDTTAVVDYCKNEKMPIYIT